MNISEVRNDGNSIVRIEGRLDAAAVQREKDALYEIADSVRDRLVMNLEKVDFIDSTGLGLIISLFRRLRERNAEMSVCCLSQQALSLFEITRMHRVLAIFPTEEAALRPPA